MNVKDYYFSQEEFPLQESDNGILKTNNLPSDISNYYNSEAYISHTNTNKTLFEKIYTQIQNLNFSYKFKILQKYFTSGNVLDYGCGNAEFLKYLSKKSKYNLFGYEPNLQLEDENIIFYSDPSQIQQKFKVIMLWHVLEHIENREEILQSLRNKLEEDGVLIIAVPNYTSLDAKFYGPQWAAWDVPRHIYHYSKEGAIEYFTQKEHFYIDKIYPLPFDSFYVSFLSAKYKNSILQKLLSPFIASMSNISALFTSEWSSLIYILRNNSK